MISSTNNKIFFIRIAEPEQNGYYHPRNRIPPLRMGYMISMLKKEYEIRFLDTYIIRYSSNLLINKTIEFDPAVLVIDFEAKDCQYALEYAKQVRKTCPHVKMICMGPYASVLSEDLIFEGSPVDFVLMGECEHDILKVIRALDSIEDLKKINSLYFREKTRAEIALIDDLNSLPMPQHTFFNPKDYFSIYPIPVNVELKWGYILSSRGCSHKCIFCSPAIRNSYGSRIRFCSTENVIREMLYLKSLGRNIVSFEDDDFTASESRTMRLCSAMINKNISMPWIAHARVTELTRDLMITMKKAGCVLLKLGIESGSNRIIGILSKDGTVSGIDWNKKVQEVFEIGKEINLSLHAMFIIGNPKETEKDLSLTRDLIKEIKPESIQIHYFVPYPGSRAFETYCQNGKFNKKLHHYDHTNIINLSEVDTKKLKKTQKIIYRDFYLNFIFVIRHIFKYTMFYLRNPRVIREALRGLM